MDSAERHCTLSFEGQRKYFRLQAKPDRHEHMWIWLGDES